jgi:hypothetical protein
LPTIFLRDLEKKFCLLFGSLTLYLLFAAPSAEFFTFSPIDQWIKAAAYSLYIFTGIVFTMMISYRLNVISRYLQLSDRDGSFRGAFLSCCKQSLSTR